MSVLPAVFGESTTPIQVLEEVKKDYEGMRFCVVCWVTEEGDVMYAYSDSGLPERNLMMDAIKMAMIGEGSE